MDTMIFDIFHRKTVQKLRKTEKELGRKLTKDEMKLFWETNKIKLKDSN